MRRRASWRATRAARSARSAISAASAFTKPRTSSPAKAGAFWSTIPNWCRRAEIMREKGTDRGRFFRGEVDKYTWQDVGSSFLPSEITAAFLWAQLEQAERITARADGDLAALPRHAGAARAARPAAASDHSRRLPAQRPHLLRPARRPPSDRTRVLAELKRNDINAVFHYVPLHSSPAGLRFGRSAGDLALTTSLVGTADPAADVAGLVRSAAAACLRRPARHPAELKEPSEPVRTRRSSACARHERRIGAVRPLVTGTAGTVGSPAGALAAGAAAAPS